jgi:uncharacterized membrane protein YozB (DUF420 family)
LFAAGNIILVLKIAVIAVSLLLAASLIALAMKKHRLHGRINLVFFVLTETALIGLEVISRLIDPDLFREFFDATGAWNYLYIHLCFAIPCAILLPIILFSGWVRKIHLHFPLALVFLALWIGTFITGVFFLPHRV